MSDTSSIFVARDSQTVFRDECGHSRIWKWFSEGVPQSVGHAGSGVRLILCSILLMGKKLLFHFCRKILLANVNCDLMLLNTFQSTRDSESGG